MAEYTNYSYLSHKLDKDKKPNNKMHLLLFYIIPFIVVNVIIFYIVTATPDFTLEISEPTDYTSTTITIQTKGFYPLKSIYAILESEDIELTKDGHTYTATLSGNGTLEVTSTNLNGMSKTVYEHISSIDDAPPVISGQEISDGRVTISLEDTQSGVDYAKIYALDASGKRITPSIIDEGGQMVTFIYDTGSLEVHVYDKVGNEALATFNDVNEGETTTQEPEIKVD